MAKITIDKLLYHESMILESIFLLLKSQNIPPNRTATHSQIKSLLLHRRDTISRFNFFLHTFVVLKVL